MAIKLLIRRVDEEQPPTEHAFEEQDLITIGRDSTADLTLLDDDMMVSRLHARLELEGGTYHLSDLGSRNFTSLHGERLTPGQHYALTSGDVFQVANYEVQFQRTEAAPKDFGETRFDVGFVNPFLTHVSTLLHSIEAIQIEYDKLPSVRKDAALTEALGDAVSQLENSPVFKAIAGLGEAPPTPPSDQPVGREVETIDEIPAPIPYSTPVTDSSETETETDPEVPSYETEESRASPSSAHVEKLDISAKDRSRVNKLLDLLIGYMSRQVKVPWQFRYEFIGHTFIPSEDSKGIYETDARGLAGFLFDESRSVEELDRRFEMVRDALDEALAHQMALLDGYRAAVSAGTKLMIEELDPTKVKEALENENIVFKYLSFLTQYRAWPIMMEKHAELIQEDVSVLERRTYRPAFIKSYLERMTASQGSHQ